MASLYKFDTNARVEFSIEAETIDEAVEKFHEALTTAGLSNGGVDITVDTYQPDSVKEVKGDE